MAAPAHISIVPALLLRLGQGGNEAERVAAAEALCHLSQHSAVLSAAISEAGGISVLLLCMQQEANSDDLLCPVVHTLSNLAHDSLDHRARIAAAGGIPLLVHQLRSAACNVRAEAAAALSFLAFDSANRKAAITASGGVPLLVRCLVQGGTPRLLECATTALCNLACECADSQAAIVAAGGIDALMQHLQAGASGEVQLSAVGALANLTLHSSVHCAAVAASGAVSVLCQCLDASRSQIVQCHAAKALAHLCSHSAEGRTAAAACAIPALVQGLQLSGSLFYAAAAMRALSDSSAQHATAIAAAGGVEALQQLQQGSPYEPVQRAAAEALASLRRDAQAEAAGDEQAVQAGPAMAAAPRVCAAEGCENTQHLLRCGGCRTVRYCSEACKNKHWRAHKTECRRLQTVTALARLS